MIVVMMIDSDRPTLLPPPPKQLRYSTFTLGLWNFWESPGLRWTWRYCIYYTHMYFTCIYIPPILQKHMNQLRCFRWLSQFGAQTGMSQGASRGWCFQLPGPVAKSIKKISGKSSVGKQVTKSWFLFQVMPVIDRLWSFWMALSVKWWMAWPTFPHHVSARKPSCNNNQQKNQANHQCLAGRSLPHPSKSARCSGWLTTAQETPTKVVECYSIIRILTVYLSRPEDVLILRPLKICIFVCICKN